MKKLETKEPKKVLRERPKGSARHVQDPDDPWIDVHDDALMVNLGIRPPYRSLRDPNVWEKTPKEKLQLRQARIKKRTHFGIAPRKSIPVRARLIIQLKKNKKFSKTTYSIVCWQHEIDRILAHFYWWNKQTKSAEDLVLKYVYNGRTYLPQERPFWP